MRAATLGELWNEATNGIASRLPGARNMMDSKGLARWRGLVCVTPENCWMRETTTEGRVAEFFCGGASMLALTKRRTVASRAPRWSIFVRQHDGDGGLRVVNVECATLRDELDQLGGAVVVADVERDRDAVNTWAGAKDGKSCHPNDIP